MSTTITQRFEIDAGHRLKHHHGKCCNYHGHRYVFLLTLEAPPDEDGFVMDFGTVKKVVGDWLDAFWDHAMILQSGDEFLRWNEDPNFQYAPKTKVYIMDSPPTAENLAESLYEVSRVLLRNPASAPEHNVRVVSVTCQETPNCSATYTKEGL